MSRLPTRIPRRLIPAFLATTILFGTAAPGLANEIQTEGVVRGGVYSDKAAGASPNSTDEINALNNAAGRKVTFGGTFHDVCETSGEGSSSWDGWNCDATKTHTAGQWSVTRALLDEIWLAQATPFANLTIPDSSASIAQGQWDTHITRWADHVKGYLDLGGGRTVIIAPLQEANWVNSGHPLYGCPLDRADYRLAFQRVVNIFRGAGMDETKVRFAFAPNAGTQLDCGTLAEYYPGHEYADVLGFSNYNFGVQSGTVGLDGWNGCVGSAWDGPQTLFDGIINQLKSLAPFKPILIAQTGAPPNNCGAPSGQTQSTWLSSLFDYAAAAPGVAGLIYFNINTNTEAHGYQGNYKMFAYPSTLAEGWKDGMTKSQTLYEWPLTDWFQPGTLYTDTAPTNPCPDGKDCNTFAFVRSSGEWVRYNGLGWDDGTSSFYYGNPGDYPIMGDWNCDGTETPGQYRQSDGYVYLRNTNTQGIADIRFFFGNPGDIPIAGDFNNDGCDTVSIYRPSNQTFYIINALGANDGGLGAADFSYVFGNPGDKPFVGDFNGNGVDTVGLHRESTGFVYYRNTHTQGVADNQFFFGNPGDKIFAGDWNGDGIDTVGIYRPGNGTVYLRFTNTQGNADYAMWVGTFIGAATG
ncbi:MAG: hypothetical protein WEA29_02760 [Acidimicrobiia bacterium]